MGFGGSATEVGNPIGALGPSSIYKRSTTLRVWCGVIFCSVFTACTTPTSQEAATGGVLRIAFPESGVSRGGLGAGSLIASSTLEGLTQVYATDGRPLPRLAESWTWENEGRRLRLKVRDGVVFHDGTRLTSGVAAQALEKAIAEPGNRFLYPSLSDITQVRADGPSHLVLELSSPSAFLPEELDLPLAIGDGSIGTGPFRLIERAGANAVLERFDRYYLGPPEIKRIEVRGFDALRTAWASLLRGEVDAVTDVPPDALDFIRTDSIQVIPFSRRYQFLIAFNSRRPPFNSPVVRRALNLAVDRQALISRVLEGQGQPATGPLWPQHWAYDSSAQSYAFDRSSATSLLSDAGFELHRTESVGALPPARFRFTCLLPNGFSLLERIGLDVQKQLFDIGVDMQFDVVTLAEYDSRIREGRFEAVLVDLISGPTFGRPFIFWRSARTFEGLNRFGYENSDAERLFGVLRTSMNEAAIRSATSRLQRVLFNDPPALFLVWNSRARAITRHFRVTDEPGRDPLLTIRQWTENSDRPAVSSQ